MNKGFNSFVWGKPLLLAILTFFGLLSALLGTGFWHLLSWIALSVPILVIGWYVIWAIKRV